MPTTSRRTAPEPDGRTPSDAPELLSAREFFRRHGLDQATSMTAAARDAGVSYATLRRHVRGGKPLGLANAQKLAAWDERISALKTLGLEGAR